MDEKIKCKTCEHWCCDEDDDYGSAGRVGDCNCPELLPFNGKRKETNRSLFVDTEYYPCLRKHRNLDKEIHKEYRRWFRWLWLGTYENFGCVCWEKKNG